MVGDLTGGTPNVWDFVSDGKADGKDISVAAKCFGSAPHPSRPQVWNPNCDVRKKLWRKRSKNPTFFLTSAPLMELLHSLIGTKHIK